MDCNELLKFIFWVAGQPTMSCTVIDFRAKTKDCKSYISLFPSGYNRGTYQSGMTFGGVRHGADIRADQLTGRGNDVIPLQMGTNQLATQSKHKIVIGGVRHAGDISVGRIQNLADVQREPV